MKLTETLTIISQRDVEVSCSVLLASLISTELRKACLGAKENRFEQKGLVWLPPALGLACLEAKP